MKPKRSAFSTVELLVVVAIVAVIAAILLPALARAKWSAKRVNSASNMRQMGVAYLLYAGDYDDMPAYAVDPATSYAKRGFAAAPSFECDSLTTDLTLPEVLASYVKSAEVRLSPLATTPDWVPGTLAATYTSFDHDCWAALNQVPLATVDGKDPSTRFPDSHRAILSESFVLIDQVAPPGNPEREAKAWACLWLDLSLSKETRGFCQSHFWGPF